MAVIFRPLRHEPTAGDVAPPDPYPDITARDIAGLVNQRMPNPTFATFPPGHPLAFTRQECERVLDAIQTHGLPDETGPGALRQQLELVPEMEWIFDRFERAFDVANDRWWRLHIAAQAVHALKYEEGDEFALHVDTMPGCQNNKLAAIVQLSEPADYRGGALRFVAPWGAGWETAPAELGAVIVAPTYSPHEVTPIEAGTRRSLVAIAFGDAFV